MIRLQRDSFGPQIGMLRFLRLMKIRQISQILRFQEISEIIFSTLATSTIIARSNQITNDRKICERLNLAQYRKEQIKYFSLSFSDGKKMEFR